MATTTIPWGDGSGDNIYLDCNALEGDQTVLVSSDANTRAPRTKTVTFSATGVTPVTLTVSQDGGPGTEHTATFYPSFYDEDDYSYYSISGLSYAYTQASGSNACTIALKRGSRAESWVYFGFDVSSIPSDAVIDSVQCVIRVSASTNNTNVIAAKTIQMYSGTTAKGSATSFSQNISNYTLSGETWTRAELNDIRIRVYGRRGTSQANTNHTLLFHGATLTVEYITYD